MKDPRDTEELTKAFTMVFAGDIRKFKMNPLKTETPWGIPYAVAMGDALEELDAIKLEPLKTA
jgi:hypothetical protein